MFTDIAGKGGNLILNVGPRGFDVPIPEEQLTRLDGPRRLVRPACRRDDRTRPWVCWARPARRPSAPLHLRVTTRFTRSCAMQASGRRFPNVASTPTTAVTTPRWHASGVERCGGRDRGALHLADPIRFGPHRHRTRKCGGTARDPRARRRLNNILKRARCRHFGAASATSS